MSGAGGRGNNSVSLQFKVGYRANDTVLEKASPLKQTGAAATSASQLQPDLEALQSGQPGIRNLQKLLLYSSEHPIPALGPNVDEDDVEDAKKIWDEDSLFERIFDGLMAFLSPDQVSFLLWTD